MSRRRFRRVRLEWIIDGVDKKTGKCWKENPNCPNKYIKLEKKRILDLSRKKLSGEEE